ncbi:DNA primase [Massilia sp. W12]|uniref:DNA primase n=1 Tax=Massilia sp. W12 TaxID=3126507 RepID=UPI0030CA9038
MIPPSFIQDLLNRVDIVDIVGARVQLKKGGANYMGLCPFHSEKSPSFTVSPSKQFYHCFGCGAHGTAIGFLIEWGGMGFVEAVRELASGVGMQVPEEDEKIPPAQRQAAQAKNLALSDLMTRAADFYRKELRGATHAIAYLKGRGLTGEIAARFGLGYAPAGWDALRRVFPDYDAPELVQAGLLIEREEGDGGAGRRYDRFRDRIMFPIRNSKGQVIAFGGRVLDQGEPKYLNSPETPLFQKGQELYGLFEGRQAVREAGYVLVTEGYMDVVALAQHGFAQAVATLGTACTSTHVQKLLRISDCVIFSFDGDNAGRRAARRALEACLPFATDGKSLKFLFLPREHDPDSFVREYGRAAFEQEVAQAMPLSQFLINTAVDENDLDEPEGRANTLNAAKPLLQALPPNALRMQIVQLLAKVVDAKPEQLEQICELQKPVLVTGFAKPARQRSAPTPLALQVMRILIAHPQLVEEVTPEGLQALLARAPESAELLEQLIGIALELGEHANFAQLSEQLREFEDFSAMIRAVAAEPEQDAQACRLELRGALRKNRLLALKEEQNQLMQGEVTPAVAQRYRDITQLIQAMQREEEAERGPR